MDKFWSKVDKTDSCWNWMGYKNKGYGRFRLDKNLVLSHRFAYELVKGKIPTNKQIDHLCKNPSCVNPEHLEAVTQQENMRRSFCISTINAKKTHCPKGHELKGDNLTNYPLRRGYRECKICTKKYMKEYYERKKHA